MSFIKSFSIQAERKNPFPYNIDAVRHALNIQLDPDITFLVGENGSGKSTLLETLAYRLQLPLISGPIAGNRGIEAAVSLQSSLEIEWGIKRTRGFFFRAEDFTDYVDSIGRANNKLDSQLKSLHGEVPEQIIAQMKESSNFALREMRKMHGQDLLSFSHGEAYLKIIHDRIQGDGIYFLDEPEAALSPSRQLSLIYFIKEHLAKHSLSQFVIATHSPMLMALPGASIYEITEDSMEQVALEDTTHYTITKGFLNDPNAYLRHLG
ncbi:MAG: AAA family ATPase [Bacteroidota bacterium]